MKLEDQCVSLDLAKRLKELGVKQESLFYWVGDFLLVFKTAVGVYAQSGAGVNDRYLDKHNNTSAFTVAELGEMLGSEDISPHLLAAYGHVFNVPDTRFTTPRGVQLCMTNPNIGAKMLIYLLENGLLTPSRS
jgi:hypothetical protein